MYFKIGTRSIHVKGMCLNVLRDKATYVRGICKKGLEWEFKSGMLDLICHPAVRFFCFTYIFFFPPQFYDGGWSNDSSCADGDCFPFPQHGRSVAHSCLG